MKTTQTSVSEAIQ